MDGVYRIRRSRRGGENLRIVLEKCSGGREGGQRLCNKRVGARFIVGAGSRVMFCSSTDEKLLLFRVISNCRGIKGKGCPSIVSTKKYSIYVVKILQIGGI